MTNAMTATVQLPPAGRYRIDPARSTITFRTRHMFGLGQVRGSFALSSGEITVTEPVARSSAHAEIAADSFETGNQARDDMIRSGKYLDTANHPTIRFTSHGVAETDSGWSLTGELTVRGTQRPVRLDIDRCGVDSGELTVRAVTRIDRKEFDITAQPGMTGRYLDLTLELAANGTPQ